VSNDFSKYLEEVLSEYTITRKDSASGKVKYAIGYGIKIEYPSMMSTTYKKIRRKNNFIPSNEFKAIYDRYHAG